MRRNYLPPPTPSSEAIPAQRGPIYIHLLYNPCSRRDKQAFPWALHKVTVKLKFLFFLFWRSWMKIFKIRSEQVVISAHVGSCAVCGWKSDVCGAYPIGHMCNSLPQQQCCGSGSVFGMRIRIQEHGNWLKFTNKPGFLPSKRLLYLCVSVFDLLPTLIIQYFSCKNSAFCDFKVWPGSGSALVWLPGSGSALKTMRIH